MLKDKNQHTEKRNRRFLKKPTWKLQWLNAVFKNDTYTMGKQVALESINMETYREKSIKKMMTTNKKPKL